MSAKAKRVPMKPTKMWAVVDNETGVAHSANSDEDAITKFAGERIEEVEVRPVQRKGAK